MAMEYTVLDMVRKQKSSDCSSRLSAGHGYKHSYSHYGGYGGHHYGGHSYGYGKRSADQPSSNQIDEADRRIAEPEAEADADAGLGFGYGLGGLGGLGGFGGLYGYGGGLYGRGFGYGGYGNYIS